MILCITFQNCWFNWYGLKKHRLAALSDKVLFASSRASLVSASEIHTNSWSLPNISYLAGSNRCPICIFVCISNVSLRLAGIGDISGMHNGFQQLQAFSHSLHQTSGMSKAPHGMRKRTHLGTQCQMWSWWCFVWSCFCHGFWSPLPLEGMSDTNYCETRGSLLDI